MVTVPQVYFPDLRLTECEELQLVQVVRRKYQGRNLIKLRRNSQSRLHSSIINKSVAIRKTCANSDLLCCLRADRLRYSRHSGSQ